MTNEKRLIDANALLAELDKFANPMPNKSGYDFLCGVSSVITEIEDAPTVEAVEVVHAEWDVIEDDYNFDTIYKCSACKEEFVTIDGTPAEKLWNYCPNCGAKMDGGNEDGNL